MGGMKYSSETPGLNTNCIFQKLLKFNDTHNEKIIFEF